MAVELWKIASDALCRKSFSLYSSLCWHWELLGTIIKILPLACGTGHLYMGWKTAEVGDCEVLNLGVLFGGNRIEEHCLAYDRKMVCKIQLMKYSWGLSLWFTAISILLFEVFSSKQVIYLAKVWESGNADVRVDGCLRLHVHSFHELFGARDQMHHLGFPVLLLCFTHVPLLFSFSLLLFGLLNLQGILFACSELCGW